MNPVQFWVALREYERGGEKGFKDLAVHALTIYSIPCSTAFVERVFSIVTYL